MNKNIATDTVLCITLICSFSLFIHWHENETGGSVHLLGKNDISESGRNGDKIRGKSKREGGGKEKEKLDIKEGRTWKELLISYGEVVQINN
jgi:hypothetical protein